jgi:hypothetical protein
MKNEDRIPWPEFVLSVWWTILDDIMNRRKTIENRNYSLTDRKYMGYPWSVANKIDRNYHGLFFLHHDGMIYGIIATYYSPHLATGTDDLRKRGWLDRYEDKTFNHHCGIEWICAFDRPIEYKSTQMKAHQVKDHELLDLLFNHLPQMSPSNDSQQISSLSSSASSNVSSSQLMRRITEPSMRSNPSSLSSSNLMPLSPSLRSLLPPNNVSELQRALLSDSPLITQDNIIHILDMTNDGKDSNDIDYTIDLTIVHRDSHTNAHSFLSHIHLEIDILPSQYKSVGINWFRISK